jgi:hypothetical protein
MCPSLYLLVKSPQYTLYRRWWCVPQSQSELYGKEEIIDTTGT